MPGVEQLLDDLGVAAARSRTGRSGRSSQSIPSHSRLSKISWTFSGVERSRSVSSIRRTSWPPEPRARSQLYSAVLALPMCSAPVGDGGKRTRMDSHHPMLIGAHVSPAGGPANAVERGEERGCRVDPDLQPEPAGRGRRASTATRRSPPSTRRWRARDVEALVIHAVYLLNCASEDPEMRDKSLTALKVALNAGAQLGAVGVVLHPGSALRTADRRRGAQARRRGDQGGARGVRDVPAAARGHRRRGRDARALVRGARDADRARRRPEAARRLPGLLPPVRLRLRRAHARVARRGGRRVRQGRRLRAPRRAARQRLDDRRWGPTATATSTSATARSASRA